MDLTASVITWRDVSLYGRAGLGRFTFKTLDGWEDLPDAQQDSNARPQAHGRFDADVVSDEPHLLAPGPRGTPAAAGSLTSRPGNTCSSRARWRPA